MEQWKPINGFDSLYEISNFGRVRSRKHFNSVLSGGVGGRNVKYKIVSLSREGKKFSYYVHRLVAFHFIRPPVDGEEINHVDFNPLNNHVSNLEWVTSKQNSIHSRGNMSKAKQGEKHPKSKMTDKQAIQIKRLRKQGKSYKEIAAAYNITTGDVANITTRYYKHVNHLV